MARCSFCGKSQDQVRKLVAGPGVFICDHCVELCNDVIAEDQSFKARGGLGGGWVRATGTGNTPGSWPMRWLRRLFHVQVRQPA